MAWSDKAVSPVVYTPAAADASGWALDDGLILLDGKITTTYPRLNLVCELLAKNYSFNDGGTATVQDTTAAARVYSQATTANKPTSDGVSMYFDGSNDNILHSPVAGAGSIAAAAISTITIYLVLHSKAPLSDTNFRYILTEGQPSFGRLGISQRSWKKLSFDWRDDDGSTKVINYENEADIHDKKIVLSVTRSNSQQKLFINGTKKNTTDIVGGNIKTSDISYSYIGGYGATYCFKGYIYKFLAYNAIHTEAQVADISAILAATT